MSKEKLIKLDEVLRLIDETKEVICEGQSTEIRVDYVNSMFDILEKNIVDEWTFELIDYFNGQEGKNEEHE